MYAKEMDVRPKKVNETMKVSQAARSLRDLPFPATLPIPSGYSSGDTSDSHSGESANSLETAIDRAIQASQNILKNWSEDRFIILPPEFSRQMAEYWTPDRQECVCRSLEGNARALRHIEILENRPAAPGSPYVVVRYVATSDDSKTRVAVRLVIRAVGIIAAFYVSP